MSNKFTGKVTRPPFKGDKVTSFNVRITGTKQDGSTWTRYADVKASNRYLSTIPGEGQYIVVEYSDLPSEREYEKKNGEKGYAQVVWADKVSITLPDDLPHDEVKDESLPF